MNREDKIRPHHFPQIPLNIVHRANSQGGNGQRFQRLYSTAENPTDESGENRFWNTALPGAAATSDLKSIEAAAYAKGYTKGEQDGIEAAAEKVQSAVESLVNAAVGLTQLRQTLARESETRLVELALAIGRKIVGYEIAHNREVIVNIAREALKSVGNQQEVTLKMNPDDLQFLENAQTPLSQLAEHINHISVEAVESIESGGCVIDSACGVIDAQIDSQLQMIEKAFETEIKKISEQDS